MRLLKKSDESAITLVVGSDWYPISISSRLRVETTVEQSRIYRRVILSVCTVMEL